MWTSAVWPSSRIVSTMPSAVSGFTNGAAACSGVVPSGMGKHWATLIVRYSAYELPETNPTVRPSRAWASGDDPAATTTPPPSLPQGNRGPDTPRLRSERTG